MRMSLPDSVVRFASTVEPRGAWATSTNCRPVVERIMRSSTFEATGALRRGFGAGAGGASSSGSSQSSSGSSQPSSAAGSSSSSGSSQSSPLGVGASAGRVDVGCFWTASRSRRAASASSEPSSASMPSASDASTVSFTRRRKRLNRPIVSPQSSNVSSDPKRRLRGAAVERLVLAAPGHPRQVKPVALRPWCRPRFVRPSC